MNQNKIEFFIFKLLAKFVTAFSLKSARKLAYPLSLLFYYLVPIRKKVARSNIELAFPKLSKIDRDKILFGSYINFSTVLIELFQLSKLSREELISSVQVENIELVNEKISQGKGLIFLSAHFGNWEWLAMVGALILNLSYSILVKPLRNNLVDDYVNNIRSKWGNKVVKVGASLREIFMELKQKKIVAILADQRASQESKKMKFFGKETSVFIGPYVLSLKMDCPILTLFIIRQQDGNYRIIIEELKVDDNLNEEDKILALASEYYRKLEKYITMYPDHWFWFHNRWKH